MTDKHVETDKPGQCGLNYKSCSPCLVSRILILVIALYGLVHLIWGVIYE